MGPYETMHTHSWEAIQAIQPMQAHQSREGTRLPRNVLPA